MTILWYLRAIYKAEIDRGRDNVAVKKYNTKKLGEETRNPFWKRFQNGDDRFSK